MTLARLLLVLSCTGACVGAAVLLYLGRWALASSLVPVIAWTAVLAVYLPQLPFFAAARGPLIFSAAGFGVVSAFFLALCIYVAYVQLPRVLGTDSYGVVVGTGGGDPTAKLSVRLEEVRPGLPEIVTATPIGEFRTGERVRVHCWRETCTVSRRDEGRILWFLLAVLGACFMVTATVALAAWSRLANL